MYMKTHILAALQEEYDHWQRLLASLSETEITTPQPSSGWSIKDEIAHLWAWQQRTLARINAALLNQEPQFPQWSTLDPESFDNTDPVNNWIYQTSREQPWAVVHQRWQAGYLQILEKAAAMSEKDLLDGNKYPWLEGHPLSTYLVASYDHHQEHLEILLDQLSYLSQ